MKIRLVALVAALSALAPITTVQAEARPIALPTDTRLVEFVYQPNQTYTILTRPGDVTNIQLSDDEELATLAMGDTAQWVYSTIPGHIFLKPVFPGLLTTATLVTNKRTYQLTLRSSPEDGKFYQQVTWHNPALIAYRNEQASQRMVQMETAARVEQARMASTVVTPNVSLESLNFDYEVRGRAPFAPSQVFDDGKFTWIRIPDSQELPAVFLLGERGEAELLNYTLRDRYIVVQRLVPGVLLKLGRDEVKITRKADRRSRWSSSSSPNMDPTFGPWGN